MEEYYFLFGVALLWTICAVVQDLRTREIANWLSFSFVGIGLAYRAFYSAFSYDARFFVFGLLGFAIFFGIANALYYSRVFAGGDAKLLMGFGVILPYSSYWSLIYLSLGFILVLFLVGALWSLGYSMKIVRENRKKFKKEIRNSFQNNKLILLLLIIIGLVGFVLLRDIIGFYMLLLFVLIGVLYVYLKALDKCMIVLKDARELSEGEWLYEDIKIGKRWVRKSVHGLSFQDIRILVRGRKKVLIKDGVPFTPAFLFALIVLIIIFNKGISFWWILNGFY